MKAAVTELVPSSGRKSFWGRANVIALGKSRYLMSYRTIVGGVDGKGMTHRFWKGRTKTTSSHIASFIEQFSGDIKSVDDFYNLEYEPVPLKLTF